MNLKDLPTNDVWDAYDWEYVFAGSEFYEGAFTAPDGQQADDITADRIAHVAAWNATSEEGYGQKEFAAVVRLADGRWAGCMAWTDTSGWGCQQGVYWRVVDTLPGAVAFGLDQRGRRWLGQSLPALEA